MFEVGDAATPRDDQYTSESAAMAAAKWRGDCYGIRGLLLTS
ncbi:MAG: hypothetical protein ACI92S_003125, partial [Planctomycetaceae bacterium]